jgi:hypothetical protein
MIKRTLENSQSSNPGSIPGRATNTFPQCFLSFRRKQFLKHLSQSLILFFSPIAPDLAASIPGGSRVGSLMNAQ